MTVLILGSSGRLGRFITNYLFSRNYKIIAHLRDYKKRLMLNDKIEKIYFDHETMKNKKLNFNKIDLIINCVGETKNENLMDISNVYFLEKILKSCSSFPSKKFNIIHFSTIAIYSNSKQNIINENTALQNDNKYEKTKIDSENLLTSYSNKFPNISYYIFRLGIVYGPNFENNILNGLCSIAKKGFLVNKKNTSCPFIDIREITQIIDLTLINKISNNQVYILTHNYKLKDILISLKERFNYNLKIINLNSFSIYLFIKLLSLISNKINLNHYVFFSSEKYFLNQKILRYNKSSIKYNLLDFIKSELRL